MNSRLQIIGLSGTNGSGKDMVGHMLAGHHNYLFISVTELLREECRKRGLPVAREHLRAISAEWRREHGLGVLVDRAVDSFEQAGGTEKYTGVVMASLRNPYEADRIHELGGTMVWVDADSEVRYQRVTGGDRGRGTEDQRTFEQFLADEEAEMHPPKGADAAALNMAAVKERADVFLDNNTSSLETLHRDTKVALGL
jgi:cytidylate kinase